MSSGDPPGSGSESNRKRGAQDCLSYSDEEADCAFSPYTQKEVVVKKKAKIMKVKPKVVRKSVRKKLDKRGFSQKFKASQSLLVDKRAKKAGKKGKKVVSGKGERFWFLFFVNEVLWFYC